jgi:hypothetical protein
MFFLYLFKNKIFSILLKYVATKKIRQRNFSPSSFVDFVGSGINIQDSQHCQKVKFLISEKIFQ